VKPHQELLTAAIEHDGEAQRSLLAGNAELAASLFSAAADLYQRSWEAAPPRSYGRLVGMLKARVLEGEQTRDAAAYVRAALADDADASGSPAAAYALAIAALIVGDDSDADRRAGAMRGGSDAFDRTAAAIAALARSDRDAYAAALAAIVEDFEHRPAHLTGVAIADTALMLERLAAPRGLSAGVQSALLPAS
jgi:hypothetical protein